MKTILYCVSIGVFWGSAIAMVLTHHDWLAFCYAVASISVLVDLSRHIRKQIKWLALLALCLMCLPARADGPTTNQLFLTWDVLPDYSTNDTFYIYSSTNVSQSVTQWPYITNITFKNFMVATQVSIPPATDVRRFYTFVSSNFTGRSDFAEPDSCRRLPSGSGLRIGAK